MLLLPVSHQDNVVRRLPWVSMGILGVCVVLQIHSSAVEPELERQARVLLEERLRLEHELMNEHLARKIPGGAHDDIEALLRKLEHGDSRALDAAVRSAADVRSRLKAGELTAPGDPRFMRYQLIEEELKALEAKLPATRFGYRSAEGGLRQMLTSMFAHAGWLHLLGNMWFLYLVGCNLEDRWGRWQFLVFYLVAGCVAAGMFGALHPGSMQSLVGASGAVAGAMGAFLVCFARTRVKIFYAYLLFFTPRWGTFAAPTWVVLGLWLLEQVAMTFLEAMAGSSVAYSAHAAGFAYGALVALVLRASGTDAALDHASERQSEGAAWSEHPTYVVAMEARDRLDHAEARRLLLELVRTQPDHVAAQEALLDLQLDGAAGQAELADVDLCAPPLIEHYHRAGRHEALVALYRRLRKALPSYGLADHELLRVATAAQHRTESALVITAVTELMACHPASPLLPRALLLAAEAQRRSGARELQRGTLERIARCFPEHACAKVARDELARQPG